MYTFGKPIYNNNISSKRNITFKSPEKQLISTDLLNSLKNSFLSIHDYDITKEEPKKVCPFFNLCPISKKSDIDWTKCPIKNKCNINKCNINKCPLFSNIMEDKIEKFIDDCEDNINEENVNKEVNNSEEESVNEDSINEEESVNEEEQNKN